MAAPSTGSGREPSRFAARRNKPGWSKAKGPGVVGAAANRDGSRSGSLMQPWQRSTRRFRGGDRHGAALFRRAIEYGNMGIRLGGRLDATNIVTPLASAITNIQYDHQKWLGETLAGIAAQKTGIIKPGIPVLPATDAAEALQVIAENGPPPTGAADDPVARSDAPSAAGHPPPVAAWPASENECRRGSRHGARAGLADSSQRCAIRSGLSRVQWAGRLQWVRRPAGQTILLDGAQMSAGPESWRLR